MFKWKGDIRNCSCNRAVKLHKHGMKVVERVLVKSRCRIVTANANQLGFIPERGTIDVYCVYPEKAARRVSC